MSSVNNNKPATPLDALRGLIDSAVKEGGRAIDEMRNHGTEDINSISKGIEQGGFLGGIVQALDVFSVGHQGANLADALTGPGKLDPKVKEGISGILNLASGNTPAALKDLFDLATAPSTPGVPPSAANDVPPPNLDQLEGNSPQVPGSDDDRSGYTDAPGPPRSQREICVCTEKAALPIEDLLKQMDFLRDSPECAARFPNIHAALNNPDLSIGQQNAVIVATVLREHPEILDALDGFEGCDEARATIPRGELPSTTPTAPVESPTPATPTAPAGGDQFGQFMQQMTGMLGGALGFVGDLLTSPAVVGILTPILAGICAAVPPLQVLIPFIPFILPVAGMAMKGAGGMMTGGAGASPGGMGGADLGGMLSSLTGGFGGAMGLPGGALPMVA